jgi:hypothetical protein
MVARTRLNVTLYLHCLSCFLIEKAVAGIIYLDILAELSILKVDGEQDTTFFPAGW